MLPAIPMHHASNLETGGSTNSPLPTAAGSGRISINFRGSVRRSWAIGHSESPGTKHQEEQRCGHSRSRGTTCALAEAARSTKKCCLRSQYTIHQVDFLDEPVQPAFLREPVRKAAAPPVRVVEATDYLSVPSGG